MAINRRGLTVRRSIGLWGMLSAVACLTVATGGAALAGTMIYDEGFDLDNPTFTPLAAATGILAATDVTGSQDDEEASWELTGLGAGTLSISDSASPNPV